MCYRVREKEREKGERKDRRKEERGERGEKKEERKERKNLKKNERRKRKKKIPYFSNFIRNTVFFIFFSQKYHIKNNSPHFHHI